MFNPVEYLWEILDSNVRHRDVFQLAWDCFDVPPEELEEVVGQSEVLCLNCCLNNLDPDGWMDGWMFDHPTASVLILPSWQVRHKMHTEP